MEASGGCFRWGLGYRFNGIISRYTVIDAVARAILAIAVVAIAKPFYRALGGNETGEER
jgi:hypothetical protein